MIALAAVSMSAAWLVILVPWRAPARPLAPVAPATPRPNGFVQGGPLWGASVVMSATLVHPFLALLVLVWPSWRRWSASRRGNQQRRRETLRALPEAADLLGLGVGSGLPVRAAIRRVAAWVDDPFRHVFVEALRRADAGEPFAGALEAAAVDLDPVSRPLVSLLATADADGGAVLAALLRVSDEGRRRRRVGAEARARRLAVTMLLPLVLCVLPAFGLLAVAPLVLTSLGDLDVGF